MKRILTGDLLRSAALALDDGAQPLQVHVRVQGSKTHIHFASAQPDTRQWLDSAADQLRELLGNHGLHLSALSVSADPGGGAQDAPGTPAQHTPRPPGNGARLSEPASQPETSEGRPTVRTPPRAAGVDFFA